MKCEACPVTGTCRVESDPRYNFLCGLAASGESSRVAAVVGASTSRMTAASPEPQEPRPLPNPHLELLDKVRGCPDGGPPGCGCDAMRSCRRFGRDVALSECLRCVQGLLDA